MQIHHDTSNNAYSYRYTVVLQVQITYVNAQNYNNQVRNPHGPVVDDLNLPRKEAKCLTVEQCIDDDDEIKINCAPTAPILPPSGPAGTKARRLDNPVHAGFPPVHDHQAAQSQVHTRDLRQGTGRQLRACA